MTISFTLPISPVTKKNSQQIVMKGKYPKLLPSKQYREFEKKCLPYLYRVKNQTESIFYPVNVKCIFYVEKRFNYDLTNLLEAADDVLVKSGLIFDDNRDIIAGHDGSRVFYDKSNPRIEVVIFKMENYSQWKDKAIERIGEERLIKMIKSGV